MPLDKDGNRVPCTCCDMDDIRRRIAEFNFQIRDTGMHQFALPLDRWKSTVGLSWLPVPHAELALVGAPEEVAGAVLIGLGQRIVAGDRFEPGVVYPVIEGDTDGDFVFRLEHVSPDNAAFLLDHWCDDLFNGQAPPMYQVILADAAGRFPNDPDFGATGTPFQPSVHPLDEVGYNARWSSEAIQRGALSLSLSDLLKQLRGSGGKLPGTIAAMLSSLPLAELLGANPDDAKRASLN